MKWRKYKKRVEEICGKDNCKFRKTDGKYYLATRISEALTYVSNYWVLLDFKLKIR
jgi:hypothetical protein